MSSAFRSFSGFIIYKYLTLEIPNSNYNVPKYELLIYVSKGNDKTRERPKGRICHVTYFTFCSPGAVLCQQNRRIICQCGGVDGRKISKNGFSLKKNHFTMQISKRFASYQHFDRGNRG